MENHEVILSESDAFRTRLRRGRNKATKWPRSGLPQR